MKNANTLNDISSNVYKVMTLNAFYISRAGIKFRIIWTIKENVITILDIVNHDKLKFAINIGEKL